MKNYKTECTCECVTSQLRVEGQQPHSCTHRDCMAVLCRCPWHESHSEAPWTVEVFKDAPQKAIISSHNWGAFAEVWAGTDGDISREGLLNIALILSAPKFLALAKKLVLDPSEGNLAELSALIDEAETIPTLTVSVI